MNEGRLVSSEGSDIDVREYEDHFEEIHVAYTNALHSVMKGRGAYFVGPLARYLLNADRLPSWVTSAAKEDRISRRLPNPFKSIIVRSLEILYACDEAIRILSAYDPNARPAVDIGAETGMGYACTEAPRGILYHRYKIGEDGLIQDAKIVPPTSQNQKTIEATCASSWKKLPAFQRRPHVAL